MSGGGAPSTLEVLLRTRRTVGAPVRLWRRSLRVRTVLTTLLLSSIALAAVGTVVSFTIGRGLFEDRKQQVLAESSRAIVAAQDLAETGTANTNLGSLQATQRAAIVRIRTAARPDGLWWTRSGGSGGAPVGDVFVPDVNVQTLVSRSLRRSLETDLPRQHWQSVGIARDGVVRPGIVVGDVVNFAGGRSAVYLVYDIQDVQDTLALVQRSLLIGGLALLVLIGAVTTIVASVVVAPLRQAARVSEQLAAGHLERRIPERGQDVVAVLARSFNRMAESLQRQITQLGNLSRVQQRFVSDVSHELRTPLTTIRLASDVLYAARDRYDAPTARSAELLRAQVERFEALLADLLEISRMDAHAADVSGEPTNLVDLAREAIDALGNLAEETGTSVHLVAPGGHAAVVVDARRIARIVRNLLSNALEHGEGRPIVVTVDSSVDAVALGVRDHGIGMTEEDAARVFDRFWRADPSRRRRIGGTGLGLAISLEDAQLHGGVLEVWSRRAHGSNFVLTLPRQAVVAELGRPVPLVPSDGVRQDVRGTGAARTPAEVGS